MACLQLTCSRDANNSKKGCRLNPPATTERQAMAPLVILRGQCINGVQIIPQGFSITEFATWCCGIVVDWYEWSWYSLQIL